EIGEDERLEWQRADRLGLGERGRPRGAGFGGIAELERERREVVLRDHAAPAIAGGLAQLERFLVAVVRGLVLAAILLDIAEPRQRRRDRALVTTLAAARERLGDLGVR